MRHASPQRHIRAHIEAGAAKLENFAAPIVKASERPLRLQQLTDERLLVRALIDQMPDFLFVKDKNSRFVVANRAIAAAYGMDNADDLIGKTDFELHPAERARGFFDREQDVIRSGVPLMDMEESFPDSAGVEKWYSTTKIPLRNQDGKIVGLVGVARDITERKQMDSVRIQQSSILEMIATNAPLASVLNSLVLLIESQLHDIKGSILVFDPQTGALRHGAAPSLPQAYNAAIDGVLIGPKVGSCGTAAYRREKVVVADIASDPLWEDYQEFASRFGLRSCWSTPILSHDNEVLGTFAMYSGGVRSPSTSEIGLIDATTRIAGIAIERRQSEDRIRYMAHHDALTGLPNRTLLNDRLSQAMLNADRHSGRVSVVFIDLDNFKVVNDGLGHVAGDGLLKIIAARMVKCVRAPDSVVRLGGDEFVVLLLDQGKGTDADIAALSKIMAAISEPVEIDGHHLQVTCSLGISVYPHDGVDAETLLKNADAAMYSAKEAGRDSLRFYTAAMNDKVLERLSLQEQLRNAVARSELFLLYQPQVDLRSGRIFAVEALIRWNHPTLGIVPPAEFIPIAEESGLIVSIGDWVLHAACQQNKAWQNAGADAVVMSVNVSARQFREKSWTSQVETALRESGMSPEHLELEMTESMLMHDLPRAVGTMQELRRLGVQLSIDDFGTGYSSLSALKSFPVCRLKIDQSFVRDLADDENDKAIASAVISLGQKMGLRVIAEGVETEEQLDFLKRNNCDEMQGYYFCKPVPPGEIERLLKAQSPAHAPLRRADNP